VADLAHGAGALVAGDERERAWPLAGPLDDIGEVDADRGVSTITSPGWLRVRQLCNGQYLVAHRCQEAGRTVTGHHCPGIDHGETVAEPLGFVQVAGGHEDAPYGSLGQVL